MTIKVESLSKRFFIHHEAVANYSTFKETISSGIQRLFPFAQKHIKSTLPSIEAFWALKDISFSVEQGDRLAIMGRNGAGKSTLFKILSRISLPTSGKAIIKGKVASLLEVGTGFHPELTGRENIFLNGTLLGMSKHDIKRHFDEIVNFADIELFLDTPVKRYSSGMYVRLAFAVAAHLEPDIMFVDEVLAVGDARFQKKCIGKMEEAAREGRTILFITHQMSALNFCNKGVLLDKGQLVPTSSLGDCIQKYNEGMKTHLEREWQGDVGDENVRIQNLTISPMESSKMFSRTGQAKVEATFKVEKPLRDLVLGYLIFNRNGVNLVHYKATHEGQVPLSLTPGLYKIESIMNIDIFSEGTFRLELDMSILNSKRISNSDIYVNFEVVNSSKKHGEPENIIFPQWQSSIKKITQN